MYRLLVKSGTAFSRTLSALPRRGPRPSASSGQPLWGIESRLEGGAAVLTAGRPQSGLSAAELTYSHFRLSYALCVHLMGNMLGVNIRFHVLRLLPLSPVVLALLLEPFGLSLRETLLLIRVVNQIKDNADEYEQKHDENTRRPASAGLGNNITSYCSFPHHPNIHGSCIV